MNIDNKYHENVGRRNKDNKRHCIEETNDEEIAKATR
jgi:hypothetical protein